MNLLQAAGQATRDASDGEPSLGGRLLYAGELDDAGRTLTVAGNIAGAATLAATADGATQKQSIRDGVADFLVTTLDEALRILKNEIRRRATVAVCVGTAPDAVEHEMHERGVVPDLLRLAVADVRARPIQSDDSVAPAILLEWEVTAAPGVWMRKLDVIARACINAGDSAAGRWLRLSPRYAGRAAQGVRVLRCARLAAQMFFETVEAQIAEGEIGTDVRIRIGDAEQTLRRS